MRLMAGPLLAAALAGCGPRAIPPAPQPAPAAPPAPVHEEVTVNPAPSIPVCVVQDGELAQVAVRIDSATGHTTTADGRPFSLALTPEYAAGADWYQRSDVIVVGGSNFTKYGTPRHISPSLLAPIGKYRGVTVFAEAGATIGPEIIYIPDRPGCSFQTYTQPHSME